MLFGAVAVSAAPVHPPLPLEGIGGLNHACGVAVDSQGDVYVSSAGQSKIEIFSPEHDELGFIEDTHEPCGLAVDSKGDVYVSEQKVGEVQVVRYAPNAYPFAGPPVYGPPTAVDTSEKARGISVDPGDDRLYVAEEDRVAAYNSDGSLVVANEVQEVRVAEATGGTFKLSFEGAETGSIPWNVSAEELKTALEALSTVGVGNVEVEAPSAETYRVIFMGALGNADVEALQGDGSGLVGGSNKGILISEGAKGFNGYVGESALSEATGVAAYSYPSGKEQFDRYLFVADAAGGAADRVYVYSGSDLKLLKERLTLDGKTVPDSEACPHCSDGFGFGPAGTSLGVDSTSGHFFVYDATHSVVDEFEATGQYLDQVVDSEFADAQPTGIAAYPQRNESQKLVTSATGGTFKLSFEGEEATLPFNAGGKKIQEALEALSAIGPGTVLVSGGYVGASHSGSYVVAFIGDLGARDVPQLDADGSGLSGASHSAVVITQAQGSGPGRLYVSTGSGAGAKVLTFGPLTAPSRAPRPDRSFELKEAEAVAVDTYGNRYVGAGSFIYVFGPEPPVVDNEGRPIPLAKISDPLGIHDLAVDSTGKVYALDEEEFSFKKGRAVYFTPSVFPPQAGTTYSGPTVVATALDFPGQSGLRGIGLNPVNGHLFVANPERIMEFDSAVNGSTLLDANFGSAALPNHLSDIEVDGSTGNVYALGESGTIFIAGADGQEVLARITGVGSPKGMFTGGEPAAFAVDQANGHVLVFSETRGVAEEYEASGAFVAEFGAFKNALKPARMAVDNACALHHPLLTEATTPTCAQFDLNGGTAYVAFFDHLTAFDRLFYGEPPVATTTGANGVNGGNATLNGTVDPRGFEVTDCHFAYLTEAKYHENGENFTGATSVPCAEISAQIGDGKEAVPVHADVSGLDPEGRYRFQLLAGNGFGESQGKAGLFGPPVLTEKNAQPILYDEATLRARIDPSGLATTYFFEYGFSESYGSSTPVHEIPADSGPTDVEVPLTRLSEGTTYKFRLVVENEAASVTGLSQKLTTLARRPAVLCGNAEYRTGRSANLPDCRAYELVTPADTRGMEPYAGALRFNAWQVAPNGEGAGGSLAFTVNGTLPSFAGSGRVDSYRAVRGEGFHPADGWTSDLFSPSFAEIGGGEPHLQGISADQEYSSFVLQSLESLKETLPDGNYLRTPEGVASTECGSQASSHFELVGCGSLGTDPVADLNFLSRGGAHVIFSSAAHLEEATPVAVAHTEALYGRAAGHAGAEVLSTKPDGSPFGPGEDTEYIGATEDGETVLFKVDGTLYEHRGGETIEVAEGPNTFAGISEDGERVFYVGANVSGFTPAAAALLACDIAAGPCGGVGAHAPIEIAHESRFVNVSASGSRVYLTSTEVFDEAEEGVEGESNLYLWEVGSIRFVGLLDPQDLASKGFEELNINLIGWLRGVSPGGLATPAARANSPTRSTPDGSVLVFESHANLTEYDAEGRAEIYRYDAEAAPGQRLICVSCDPSGTPPGGDASLQSLRNNGATDPSTLIPNVTDDGSEVFFESPDRLLPEDANDVQDAYVWQAQGTEGCKRPGGCLALISSGQGDTPSFLYSMTPDGHDVFFRTSEKLVGADLTGSPSIYDARVEGGIPELAAEEACQGDACQGNGNEPPALPVPASTGSGGEENPQPSRHCRKGRHRVHGRCVARHGGKHHRTRGKRRQSK